MSPSPGNRELWRGRRRRPRRVPREEPGGEPPRDRRDRDGEREHPPPRGPGDDEPGDDDARDRPDPGQSTPHRRGTGPSSRIRIERPEQRERRRGRQRRAATLGEAGADQGARPRRETRHQRRRAEEAEADGKDPLSPEPVRQTAAHEEEAAEGETVGGVHEDQLRAGGVERRLDPGERHRYHRDREDQRELHRTQDGERGARTAPRRRRIVDRSFQNRTCGNGAGIRVHGTVVGVSPGR